MITTQGGEVHRLRRANFRRIPSLYKKSGGFFPPPTCCVMVENGVQVANSASGSVSSARLKRLEHELRKCLGKENHGILLKSYSCAWQREILVQGRLYITPNWFCFYSSILGWETKTAIKCQDVTSISKQKTVFVFPNAVLIEVGDKKFGFTSLVHRDKAFQVLCLVWQNSLLEQPLSVDELRIQLKDIKRGGGNFERSLSFTQESSDPESVDSQQLFPLSPPSPSALSRMTSLDSHTSGDEDKSSSHSIDSHNDEDSVDDVDGAKASSSTDVEEASPTASKTSDSDEGSESDTSSSVIVVRSPSLVALASSETSSSVDDAGHGGIQDGSAVNVARSGASKTLLWKLCNPSIVINCIILLSIFVVALSSVSMLCRLSHVEPALRPYLPWQPWCSLCVSVSEPPAAAPSSPFSYEFSSTLQHSLHSSAQTEPVT